MKALKLANEFRTSMTHEVMTSWGSDSAIELRRLAEVNADLMDILNRLIIADEHQALDSAMLFAYAKRFLAKAEEQQ